MSATSTKHALENLKPTDLPTPPQAEIRIVQACSDDNVTSKELATLISSDPVITAELLRMVNSAFYGLSREVSTINHAVTILGQRALRNLALCLSLRDALKDDYIHGFKIEEYWEDALRRAVAARFLGKLSKLDHDECFTIGLLQDFGMLAVFHTQPELNNLWVSYRKLDPEARYKRELEDFGITHDKAGLMLGCAWELPQELISAMAYHHHGDYKNMKPQDLAYCKIALCSDWIASIFTAEDKASTLKNCKKLLKNIFKLSGSDCDDMLMTVADEVTEAAQALGLNVPATVKYEDVMR
ncbi:MAG: HDOD domain-containing protein, partial [Gammaproteobacteria bacterium]|nr:HDOD domain-containing protein [Gammaproteobacteria bacterium]